MSMKKISRRKFLQGMTVTAVGAVGAQIMAACAPVTQPQPAAEVSSATEAEATAPPATDVVLRVQVPPQPLSIMATEFGQRFQDETGVEVVIEETIYAEIETKTQTGFISNTLQDILYGHHRWIFINFLKGIYLELDDTIASDPPPDFDDIYPTVLTGNQFEGKTFNLPDYVHPGGNIAVNYNKQILEEKGLPEPQDGWTMDDWKELAMACADPENGVFGLGFDSMSAMHYYSNVSRCWGDPASTESWIMDEEGKTLSLDTPIQKEVAMWYLELLEKGIAPRKADYIEDSAGNIFVAGLNATHASTTGNVAQFKAKIGGKFETDAALLPVGSKGRQGTCYSGNHYLINSQTEHPEEAYELLKRFTSIEAGIFQVVEANMHPNGHKSAWTDPEVNKVNRMFGVSDKILSGGVEPYPMPWNTRFTEANDIFRNEMDLIWEGDVTWDEHASVIQRKVQEILDLDRPS